MNLVRNISLISHVSIVILPLIVCALPIKLPLRLLEVLLSPKNLVRGTLVSKPGRDYSILRVSVLESKLPKSGIATGRRLIGLGWPRFIVILVKVLPLVSISRLMSLGILQLDVLDLVQSQRRLSISLRFNHLPCRLIQQTFDSFHLKWPCPGRCLIITR